MKLSLLALSDLHGIRPFMPEYCDLCILAGDLCIEGARLNEYVSFDAWLSQYEYRNIITIPGNHDRFLEETKYRFKKVQCLYDESVEVDDVKIYGSPWAPTYTKLSFERPRKSKELHEIWKKIPSGIDILITHCPPHGILDEHPSRGHLGCELLAEELERIKPRVHIFGHIHPGSGWLETKDTLFINASILNGKGKLENADPYSFEIEL